MTLPLPANGILHTNAQLAILSRILPDLPDLRVVTLFSLKATALNSSGASSGGLKSILSRSWATPNPVRPPDTTYFGTAFFVCASSPSSASSAYSRNASRCTCLHPDFGLVRTGVDARAANFIKDEVRTCLL